MSRAGGARGPVRGANTPILMGVLVSAAGAVGALISSAVTALRRVKTLTVKSRAYRRWCMMPPFSEGISWLCCPTILCLAGPVQRWPGQCYGGFCLSGATKQTDISLRYDCRDRTVWQKVDVHCTGVARRAVGPWVGGGP